MVRGLFVDVSVRRRLLRVGVWSLAVVCALEAAVRILYGDFGVDSHAYWGAWQGQMYTTGPNTRDAYLYSPAFAQLIWPLAQLPWLIYALAVSASLGLLLAWLLKPLGWGWAIPCWLIGLPEVASGNIFVIFALLALIGFSRPSVWTLTALTKITPTIGPIWFLARGEWGKAFRFSMMTTAITLVSYAASPDLWLQWFTFLAKHLSTSTQALGSEFLPPPLVRFPAALALTIWGARGNHRWTVPVAMLIATPVLWLGSFTILAALPRLKESGIHAESGRDGSKPAVGHADVDPHFHLGGGAGLASKD